MNTNKVPVPGMFEPFRLYNYQLRNRLVVTPMSRVSATTSGVPSSAMQTYYEAFALGGFSMIITEGIYTDTVASQSYPLQPGIVTPAQVQEWSVITARVKQQGSLIIAQLMHGGAISQHLSVTWAPSAIKPLGHKMPEYGGEGPFPLPHAMTEADMATVKLGFIQSALQAYTAGFNGVELHAANGYLLDQMLTEYTNTRTDLYGGNVTNRFRLIAEIITGIRAVVPSGFIIGLRLSEGKVNNLRYRWPDGAVTAREVLTEVTTAPPDYIHIAAETGNWAREAMYPDGTSFTGLAKQITGLPVIANGGLHQPELAKQVLEEGHADLLAIGKAALANPDWPLRVQRGESTIPFHPGMIKPSATIEHTWKVLAAGVTAINTSLPADVS